MNSMICLIMVREKISMLSISARSCKNCLPSSLLKIQSNSMALISSLFCFFLLISDCFCSSDNPAHLYLSLSFPSLISCSFILIFSSRFSFCSVFSFSVISLSFSFFSSGDSFGSILATSSLYLFSVLSVSSKSSSLT